MKLVSMCLLSLVAAITALPLDSAVGTNVLQQFKPVSNAGEGRDLSIGKRQPGDYFVKFGIKIIDLSKESNKYAIKLEKNQVITHCVIGYWADSIKITGGEGKNYVEFEFTSEENLASIIIFVYGKDVKSSDMVLPLRLANVPQMPTSLDYLRTHIQEVKSKLAQNEEAIINTYSYGTETGNEEFIEFAFGGFDLEKESNKRQIRLKENQIITRIEFIYSSGEKKESSLKIIGGGMGHNYIDMEFYSEGRYFTIFAIVYGHYQ